MTKLMTTAAVLVALIAPASALVIHNDNGGNLGTRFEKIAALKKSGEQVRLIGRCVSSCTQILSLPWENPQFMVRKSWLSV